MTDVIECKSKLRELADELDKRSRELRDTNLDLAPKQEAYDDWIMDFEADLHAKHEAGASLPSKDMRVTLALKEMPSEFRKEHRMLVAKRDRLKQHIQVLKVEIESWRSLLSAEKAEMEAIGS